MKVSDTFSKVFASFVLRVHQDFGGSSSDILQGSDKQMKGTSSEFDWNSVEVLQEAAPQRLEMRARHERSSQEV